MSTPVGTHHHLRLVLVSRAFYPRVGGIETHTALLADYLHKRGHQVTVLTEAAGPEAHLFDPDQPASLDAALRAALNSPPQHTLSPAVAAHLDLHTLNTVGARFEQTIAKAVHSNQSRTTKPTTYESGSPR